MSFDEKILREFDKEIWLYLDNDLTEEKMQYWTKLIDENEELKKEFELIKSTSNLYHQTTNYNLDDITFNKIIDKAINKKKLFSRSKDYFSKILNKDEEHLFSKVAFASLLIVFAVMVSLVSEKPNPTKKVVQTIKSEILDWDAKLLDNQINKIETLLLLAKNDGYKKYYMNQISSNEWNKNTYEIETKIEKIKNDLGKNEF